MKFFYRLLVADKILGASILGAQTVYYNHKYYNELSKFSKKKVEKNTGKAFLAMTAFGGLTGIAGALMITFASNLRILKYCFPDDIDPFDFSDNFDFDKMKAETERKIQTRNDDYLSKTSKD